ncbi:MAG: glycerophosphodiester phosphodiesterase family protein, partial [bacterium]
MYRLAHRGLSEFYPENTMLAFRKALDEDFDGIETDVQMTKDGVLVLLHDETIDRTSNGKGQLKSFTYKELLSYTFSNGMPYPEPIPRLDELLALMKKTDKILNIEIKGDVDLSACVKVVNEVRNFKLEKQVYFSSVSVLHLIRIRELMPDAYVAIISVHN